MPSQQRDAYLFITLSGTLAPEKKKTGPAFGSDTRRTSSLKWLVRGKETCAVSASMVRSFADPVNECLVVVRRHAVVKEGAGAMVVPG